MFRSNLFAPWQEIFADARDGDGEGPFEIILESFEDHFRTPLYQQIMFSNPKSISLKRHILMFPPPFEKHHTNPYVTKQNYKHMCLAFHFSNISKLWKSKKLGLQKMDLIKGSDLVICIYYIFLTFIYLILFYIVEGHTA